MNSRSRLPRIHSSLLARALHCLRLARQQVPQMPERANVVLFFIAVFLHIVLCVCCASAEAALQLQRGTRIRDVTSANLARCGGPNQRCIPVDHA